MTAALRRVPESVGKPADENLLGGHDVKTNSATLNALCTLFGARAASRIFKQSRGRASHILEEARASYGAGWDAIRAVHALMEQAFLETPAAEIIDSSSSCRERKVCRAIEPETAKATTEKI